MSHSKTFSIIVGMVIIFIGGIMICCAAAQTNVSKVDKVEINQVTGIVTFVMPNAINIEFDKGDGIRREMVVLFDATTVLTRMKSTTDLQGGDTVTITYKDTYKEDETGKRSDYKRIATQIVLIRNVTAAEAALRPVMPVTKSVPTTTGP